MKSFYFKSILAVLCFAAIPNLRAQTYTSGDITAIRMPNMNHDSTMCSSSCMVLYNISIASSFVGDTVRIIDTILHTMIFESVNTTGASPWMVTAVVSPYNSPFPDYMLSSGMAFFSGPVIKIISGSDTVAYIPNSFPYAVTGACDYGSASGRVYIDNNGDCIYNTGDEPLNGIYVTSEATLSSPSVSTYNTQVVSNPDGTYSATIQQSWMTSYDVSLPPSYYFIFPVSPCFSGAPYTFTTLPQVNVDFPLLCSSNIDVQVAACAAPAARLHTPLKFHPNVSNTGCDTASGQLKLVKDSRVVYNPALSLNPATYVSGDTLVWNYSGLTNLSSGSYWNSFIASIYLEPDATVVVGDTLCFHVFATVLAADINPANNDYTYCMPVVYSYDPNMKQVMPAGTGAEGYIPAGTPSLTYTLHFQNTGTAAAINVNVVDTLDTDVDPSKLRIIDASHAMVPEWVAPGVVKFNFNNIYLPDSLTDEPNSHGYVQFSVPLDAGLTPGTQIKNKGYIYFDANPPVITNTALNTIETPSTSNVAPAALAMVKVYPNPASTSLFIENLEGGYVSVMDVRGAVVIDQSITNGKANIDISALQPGIYILKTRDQHSTTTRKFTKL